MELSDICDAGFGERRAHFMKQICPHDAPDRTRHDCDQVACSMAQEEMLDEIHVMLRELLKRSAPTPAPEDQR